MAESADYDRTKDLEEILLQIADELSHHDIIQQNRDKEQIIRLQQTILEIGNELDRKSRDSLEVRSKPEPAQVDSFKKSMAEQKQHCEELSKVIEQTIDAEEDVESNVKDPVYTSSRASWRHKIINYVKSASDVVDQTLNQLMKTAMNFYPQVMPETPIQTSGVYHTENAAKCRMQRICMSCSSVKDSTNWELILPEAVPSSGKDTENVKYRFTAAPGSYECKVTGLRWESSSEVELEYCWSDWALVSEVLEKEQYHPCGPLLDITIIRGKLNAVHLPHFLCLGSESSLSDAVRVFHYADVGAFFERCILTCFHAALLQPTFSPRGPIVKSLFQTKAHFVILIYCVLASPLTLRIFPVVDDAKVIRAVKKDWSDNCKQIIKPNPIQSLQMKSWYHLKTVRKINESTVIHYNSNIHPPHLKLGRNAPTSNFFEVFIRDPEEVFYLQLVPGKDETEEKGEDAVWEAPIRERDYLVVPASEYGRKESSSDDAVWFVDKHMNELVRRVRLVSPIADDLKLLIGDEKYSVIRGYATPQEQMRTLYTFLAGGQGLKVKFYESLQKNEPLLVEELQMQVCS